MSGVNIYFSELYQEASQFDRANTGISRFAGLLRLAGANLFTLEWRKGIPQDADLIVIVGPATDILPENVARLWAYLQRGGRGLLAVDAFDAPILNPSFYTRRVNPAHPITEGLVAFPSAVRSLAAQPWRV